MNGTHEIIELTESFDFESKNRGKQQQLGKAIKKHSIEDDINKLFEAIGHSERHIRDVLHKSAMKRPMRVGPSQASCIGVSESTSLKQALRGLCISQASEMAAVKKRMSRLSASPGVSEAGAIKKLYKTVVIEAGVSAQHVDEVKGSMMEICIVPERSSSNVPNKANESKLISVPERRGQCCHNSAIVSSTSSSNQDHVQPSSCKTRSVVMKVDERSRAKGEFSQSSKSSIGDYSSTTSYSEESYLSGSSRSGHRPHMSKDLRWEAISVVQKQQGILGMKDFKLLRKIGGGDIGTVYLSELNGMNCLFAVKVMDNEFLGSRRKMHRAQTEKEILEILDHPFLPTLYLHFTTRKYSCLVMEYCPGGDLHVLRQKQPNRSFTEKAAR